MLMLIVFVDDIVVVVFIVGDAFDFVLLMFLFFGMVVTRQGKMSRRLWVDVIIFVVDVADMVVVVHIHYSFCGGCGVLVSFSCFGCSCCCGYRFCCCCDRFCCCCCWSRLPGSLRAEVAAEVVIYVFFSSA